MVRRSLYIDRRRVPLVVAVQTCVVKVKEDIFREQIIVCVCSDDCIESGDSADDHKYCQHLCSQPPP